MRYKTCDGRGISQYQGVLRIVHPINFLHLYQQKAVNFYLKSFTYIIFYSSSEKYPSPKIFLLLNLIRKHRQKRQKQNSPKGP